MAAAVKQIHEMANMLQIFGVQVLLQFQYLIYGKGHNSPAYNF